MSFEKLIADHNTKMDLIRRTSDRTGLSEALLFYSAAFGIYNTIDTPKNPNCELDCCKGQFNEPIHLSDINPLNK